MRQTTVLGLLACLLAATAMVTVQATRHSDNFTNVSFADALGAPKPDAPLTRQPAEGVSVRIGRKGFKVAGRHGRVSISSAAPSSSRWARFARGAARPTTFGRETVVVTPEKTEQFLTVERRQGLKTWQWQLSAAGQTPRVGDDGAVAFLDEHRVGAMHVEPVAILDERGRDITPKGLRWSVAQGRHGWLLKLSLDDSKLPLPYVIDPAVSYRLAQVSNNGAAGASSIVMAVPAGVVDNDLLFMHIAARGGSNMTIATPGGWTALRNTNNTTVTRLATFYRIASSEPASYTVTFGGGTPSQQAVGAITAYYGVKSSGALDVNGATGTGNSATPSAGSIGAAANTLVIAAYSHGIGNGTTGSAMFTTAAGMNERYDAQSQNATAANRSSAAADDILSFAGGATGAKAVTASASARWVAHQVSFLVDNVNPTGSTTFPAASSYNAAGWAAGCATAGTCGSAADADSSVQKVEVSIRQGSGNYWNGSAFASASEVWNLATGTTSWSYAFNSFPADGSYTVRVQVTDTAANASVVSTVALTYDTTAPALPTSLASSPGGPANDNAPEIAGTAEAGSTVNVYPTAGCTGAPSATGTAAAFSSPGLTVAVSDDTSTTYKATATDAAGNVSGCSSSSVTYVEDSTAPALPASLASSPAGPANDNAPEITGSAEAGSTVNIYTTAGCTGAPNATGTAAAFSSPGITASVSDDTSTTFKATATDAAGNVSGCSSSSVTYVEDSTAPGLPSSLASSPVSPANDNAPEITGSAEAGSTVKIYTTAGCTGAPTATGSAATFSSPGITVAVSDDSSTTFKATATDAAGNVSGCSSSSVTYVEDSTAPALPASLASSPAGPANDNAPEITGSAEAGSTVKLYTTAGCTGAPNATGTAAAFSSPGITASVSDDTSTTFKATATDAAGNVSGCSSSSITYVEDSTAPALPASLSSSPAGPANDNAPEILGTAEAGSTVKLYTTAACTGAPTASGSAATFSSPGITVAVSDDSSTTFKATATDSAGNVSGCSSSSVTYVEDSTAPALPASLGSSPASPANDNAPEITGSAEAGSTVKLYSTAGCTGAPDATGTAATFSSPGITVAVVDDSSTTFKATATDAAGNVSGCSVSSVTYLEDSTAPALPSSLGSMPASPANDNSPKISGTAEAGSTVKLYATSDCSGAPTASGSAATFSSPGITVAVADDSTTTFKATATDAAGNVSGCSSSSVTYVEDSTAPALPASLASTPPGPANDNAPEISGTAEAGSTVKVYATSDCSGAPAASGTAATFSTPGLTVVVGDDSSTTFRATATDSSGNVSGCSSSSVTYVEDSTAPALPSSLGSAPASPANDNSPKISGTAEAGSTVKLYATSDCSGTPEASGSAATFSSPGITVAVADDSSTTFKATATDAAGNVSGCSAGYTYVEDSTAPALPSSLASTPASPANDNSPKISGTAEAGSTVKLYATSDCSGTPEASGSAATFSSPGITAAVADDSTTTFKATATDAAGNVSGCSSSSVTYVEDSTAPALPASLASTPTGPANDNSPEISGSAEAGSTVSVYATSDCSGPAEASGSAATFSSPGITVAVADDSTTIFKATATDAAGNVSGCSASSVTYVEDSSAPAVPASLASTPVGPANDNAPEISGTAEAGSTVKVYATSDCSGAPEASGSAAMFSSPGITVAVADDSSTTFRATATDVSGNVSGCSVSSVTYVEDSTGPSAPSSLGSTPASPANDNAPKITGSAEAGSTVKLYTSSDCSGAPTASGSAATFSSPGIAVAVADDSTTTFKATATDAAGNVSACSSGYAYVEDSTAPSSTVGFPAAAAYYSPSAWSAGCATAGYCGTATDSAGSGIQNVKISIRQGSGNYYDGASFSSAAEIYLTATGTTSWNYAFATTDFPVDGSYTIHVKATDAAGNVEAFSSRTFVFDSSPPSAPSLSFSNMTNASATGQTVYFRSGAAGGLTVTASSNDPHSGISGYGFPALGSGWSGTQSGADYDYSFTAAAVDPVEPNDVTAQNNAGLTSSASFTVTPDALAPVTSILCDGASCSGNWYTSAVSISLSANDAGSGVDRIRYTTDGSDPSPINGNDYAAPFSLGATATVKFRAYDEVGNEETVGSQLIRIDDSPPSAPALTVTESPASANQHVSGTTLYYNPQGGNSGSFTVGATTGDAQSGIDKVSFPALAGMTGGGDDSSSPYQDTYSWTASSSANGSPSVVSHNNAGLTASTTFDVTPDTAAPSGGFVSYPGGYQTGSITITTDDGTDALSGVNGASGVIERDATPLVDGSCDPFPGTWITVTSPDSTIQSGNCYRYRYSVSDNVGNGAVYTTGTVVRVSTGSPSAPSLTLAESPASPSQHVAGTTLYYNPAGSNAGTFSVGATVADSGGSGIDHVSFPTLTGMTGGGNDFSSPYQSSYDWDSASSASGAQTVTVHNNAGLTSSATFTVTPDLTGPMGQGASVTGGYYTALSVPVSLSNGADALSGVDATSGIVERQDGTLSNGSCVGWGGGWSPVTLVGGEDTTVLTNSCYRYRYTISDNVGNPSAPSAASLDAQVDATPPLTSDDAPVAWQNAAVTVTLSVNETGSGVASTSYRVDGGAFQSGTSIVVPAPADHSNDGVHTVEYRSTDNAGNAEALRSATVRIDTTLPTTTDDAPAGWQSSPVTVTLTASDALSGIASTDYRVDGGAFQSGTSVLVPAPADHSNDGVHTIEYRSTDNAGNVEGLRSATVRIDTDLPTGAIMAPAAGAHVNGIVAISAAASDVTSGVASVEFLVRPNGSGSFQSISTDTSAPYDATWDSTTAAEGDADLKVVVLDNAGLPYTSAVTTIVVDNPPVPTLLDPGNFISGTVTLQASSQPDTAQVVFERSPAGQGTWTQIATDTTAPFAADFDTTAVADGDYDFRVIATDLAGFSGTSALQSSHVDNTAPTTAVTDPASGAVVGGANVHLAADAADGDSGIASVRFEYRPASGGAFTAVGTDTTAPYEASWDTTGLTGGYEVRSVATDAAGNQTAAVVVPVVVDQTAPSVTLGDPGSLLRGVVPLAAAAPSLHVTSVSFERRVAGGAWVQIALDTTRPFEASLDTTNLADGAYDLRAQALGAGGQMLATHSRDGVRIDNTAPTMVRSTPAGGSNVGSATSIVVTASEPLSAVRGVTVDGRAVAGQISGTKVTFATGNLGPGPHFLSGTLVDAAGNEGVFEVGFAVQPEASVVLQLQVGRPKTTARGNLKLFMVPVTISTAAKVDATLFSPTGRKLRAVHANLNAGTRTIHLSVPSSALPPGRYAIVVTATAAGSKITRTVHVTIKAKKAPVAASSSGGYQGPKAVVVVAAPLGPPPSSDAAPPRPAAKPRPVRAPRPEAKPAPKVRPAGKLLEAASSKYSSSGSSRTAGFVVILLGLGGALAVLIKVELGRMLSTKRLG